MEQEGITLEIQDFENDTPTIGVALVAGGMAGTVADLALFPIDTMKTRLQSAAGFSKSGGFRGMYSGLGPVAVGSAPYAAIYFCTYEGLKKVGRLVPESYHPLVHMAAASAGEVISCVVGVPVEVVKQRAQANTKFTSSQVFRMTIRQEGIRGLYRGYLSTVIREIPLSFIQMPIWEILKKFWSRKQQRAVNPWESATCGALSGGVAAAITTPLDVAKTRIMLAKHGTKTATSNIFQVIHNIGYKEGVHGLFAGVLARTLWMSLGACIFFGIYEKSKIILS